MIKILKGTLMIAGLFVLGSACLLVVPKVSGPAINEFSRISLAKTKTAKSILNTSNPSEPKLQVISPSTVLVPDRLLDLRRKQQMASAEVDAWIAALPSEKRKDAAVWLAGAEASLGCAAYAELNSSENYADLARFCRQNTSRIPVSKNLLLKYASYALGTHMEDPYLASLSMEQLATISGTRPVDAAFKIATDLGMPEAIQQKMHDKVVSNFVILITERMNQANK